MKKIWLGLFFIISATELVSVTFDVQFLHALSKPLLLPALMGYFLSSVKTRNHYFLSALIFCWAGDVLLMFQGEMFFISGLGAFLTGHVLYIFCYRQLRYPNTTAGLLATQKIRFSLPIMLAGTGLVTILFPYLGEMKVPVMIYALVITAMAVQALFRYGFTTSKSFTLIFTGALFFMLSDSLLAINKFMSSLPLASLAIMTTYLTAQYLIVEGFIAHHDTTTS